jgi:dipeptidyl aminopeptidase/acylaminoacyl peptidase
MANGAAAADPVQVTSGPDEDFFPCWSPDGKRLAFVRRSASGFGVWIAPADGGAPRLVLEPAGYVRWDRTGRRLLVAVPGVAGPVRLVDVDPESDSVTPLPAVSLDPDSTLVPFDISPSGELLATEQEEARGDVWVLDRPMGFLSWR